MTEVVFGLGRTLPLGGSIVECRRSLYIERRELLLVPASVFLGHLTGNEFLLRFLLNSELHDQCDWIHRSSPFALIEPKRNGL